MKFKGIYILKVSLKVILVYIWNEGQFMSCSFIAHNPINVELLQFVLEVSKELLLYIEYAILDIMVGIKVLWENDTIILTLLPFGWYDNSYEYWNLWWIETSGQK